MEFTNDELKLIHQSLYSRARHLAKRVQNQAQLGISSEGPHEETDKTIQELCNLIEKLEPMIQI